VTDGPGMADKSCLPLPVDLLHEPQPQQSDHSCCKCNGCAAGRLSPSWSSVVGSGSVLSVVEGLVSTDSNNNHYQQQQHSDDELNNNVMIDTRLTDVTASCDVTATNSMTSLTDQPPPMATQLSSPAQDFLLTSTSHPLTLDALQQDAGLCRENDVGTEADALADNMSDMSIDIDNEDLDGANGLIHYVAPDIEAGQAVLVSTDDQPETSIVSAPQLTDHLTTTPCSSGLSVCLSVCYTWVSS